MSKFIENAVMLYRENPAGAEIDGKFVDCQMADKDDETDYLAALEAGWKEHSDMWPAEAPAPKAPKVPAPKAGV